MVALERFEQWIDLEREDGREVALTEAWGSMQYRGVRVHGQADRIDRMPDGTLGIVDYKTGSPPKKAEVAAGYRLQLGVLGLIARHGGFKRDRDDETETPTSGEASAFEYWSLAKHEGAFGKIVTPIKGDKDRTGVEPGEFLPLHEKHLAEAITRYILGSDPFTARENPNYPGYTDYDQLMRLEEWYFAQGSAQESGQ